MSPSQRRTVESRSMVARSWNDRSTAGVTVSGVCQAAMRLRARISRCTGLSGVGRAAGDHIEPVRRLLGRADAVELDAPSATGVRTRQPAFVQQELRAANQI